MIDVKSSVSIYQLSKICDQTIAIMTELGFSEIAKPGMIQTAGRIMTLKKGCAFKKIDYQLAKDKFLNYGIRIVDEKNV